MVVLSNSLIKTIGGVFIDARRSLTPVMTLALVICAYYENSSQLRAVSINYHFIKRELINIVNIKKMMNLLSMFSNAQNNLQSMA